MTVVAYALVGSKSLSPGRFLISRFSRAPEPRAYASTSARVAVGMPAGAGAVAPAEPSTSTRHAANRAAVTLLTSPVQFVVRSSVSSWITTGTRSLVSLTSSSSTARSTSPAYRNAGIVSSPKVGTPAVTLPPRWAWISGPAAAAAAGTHSRTRTAIRATRIEGRY